MVDEFIHELFPLPLGSSRRNLSVLLCPHNAMKLRLSLLHEFAQKSKVPTTSASRAKQNAPTKKAKVSNKFEHNYS